MLLIPAMSDDVVFNGTNDPFSVIIIKPRRFTIEWTLDHLDMIHFLCIFQIRTAHHLVIALMERHLGVIMREFALITNRTLLRSMKELFGIGIKEMRTRFG